MKLFTFPRLFSRAQPVRPATVQVHTDAGTLPPWLNCRPEAWPLEQRPLEYYAPKQQPLDPIADFLLSLSPDKRAKLSRLVRHGYFGGSTGPRASNVVQFRMAA